MNLVAGFSRRSSVRLVAAESGTIFAIGDNGKRKCAQERWICRRISRGLNSVGRSAAVHFSASAAGRVCKTHASFVYRLS